MKTTKQLRAEFYGFIYKNLGEFAPIIKQEIKGRLNEYAKVFNKILVSEKAILEERKSVGGRKGFRLKNSETGCKNRLRVLLYKDYVFGF